MSGSESLRHGIVLPLLSVALASELQPGPPKEGSGNLPLPKRKKSDAWVAKVLGS